MTKEPSEYDVKIVDGALVDVVEGAGEHTKKSEKNYDRVWILPSGWVKCAEPSEHLVQDKDDDHVVVDHYPPDRVIGVYSVEEKS